eukprot:8673053-Pyramimonas_sp.AAC.1
MIRIASPPRLNTDDLHCTTWAKFPETCYHRSAPKCLTRRLEEPMSALQLQASRPPNNAEILWETNLT